MTTSISIIGFADKLCTEVLPTCSMGGVLEIGGIAGFWRGFAGFAPSCGGLLGTFAGRGGHRCCTVVALALWSAVMRAGRFGGLPFRGSPA